MNKKEVLQVIRNPKSLNEVKLKEIEKIALDFPYFQGAHTLVAIGHEKFHNPAIKRSLSKAALYATDRKFLKQLLDSLKSTGSPTSRTAIIKSEPIAVPPQKVSTPAPAEVAQAPAPSPEPEVSEPAAVEAPLAKAATTKINEVTLPPAVQLVSSTEAKEVEEEEEKTTGEKDLNEVLYLSHDELLKEVFSNLEALKKTKSHYLEVERKIEDAEFEEAKAKAVKKANSNFEATKVKNGNSAKSGKAAKSAPLKRSDTQNGKKVSAGNELEKPDQNQIIEEFIKKNPSIKTQSPGAGKSKSAKAVDLSAPSVQLKDDVATENMALIYIKQGRNDKAIEVYQKLIWKYPHKKAYFAAQIENIQK